MLLYLTAKTNIPDVYIDYISVRLKTGQEVSLNWDESDISRSEEGFDARYKGVYFGDEYANGRIVELENYEIEDVGLYFESRGKFYFQIEEMEFEDYENTLVVSNPKIPDSVLYSLELPYLSDCKDFDAIKASCSHELMKNMEEAIRLYMETDKIGVEEDGRLYHVDGEVFFESAIAWYCGLTDTKDFISDFGDLSAETTKPSLDNLIAGASSRSNDIYSPSVVKEQDSR